MPGNSQLDELLGGIDRIPRDRPVINSCGSGLRAMIADSILKLNGVPEVEDCLGSMSICSAVGCPIIT